MTPAEIAAAVAFIAILAPLAARARARRPAAGVDPTADRAFRARTGLARGR